MYIQHMNIISYFIGTYVNRVVTLSNRSSIPVHFEWKSMATEEEEQYQRDQ